MTHTSNSLAGESAPGDHRNTGSNKSSELGPIPTEWKLEKLGDLGKFAKGKGIKRDQLVPHGVPCIRYGEIYTHHGYFHNFVKSGIRA